MIKNLKEVLAKEYPYAVYLDSFDDCFVGILERQGSPQTSCYNKEKMIISMMKKMNLSFEETNLFFEKFILPQGAGLITPSFIHFPVEIKKDISRHI